MITLFLLVVSHGGDNKFMNLLFLFSSFVDFIVNNILIKSHKEEIEKICRLCNPTITRKDNL